MGWHFELGSNGMASVCSVVQAGLIHVSRASTRMSGIWSSWASLHTNLSFSRVKLVQNMTSSQKKYFQWNAPWGLCSKLVQFNIWHILVVKTGHEVSRYSRGRGADFYLDVRKGRVTLQKAMHVETRAIYGHLVGYQHVDCTSMPTNYTYSPYVLNMLMPISGPNNSHLILWLSSMFKVHDHMLCISSGGKETLAVSPCVQTYEQKCKVNCSSHSQHTMQTHSDYSNNFCL